LCIKFNQTPFVYFKHDSQPTVNKGKNMSLQLFFLYGTPLAICLPLTQITERGQHQEEAVLDTETRGHGDAAERTVARGFERTDHRLP
jgi:hypothetical protein